MTQLDLAAIIIAWVIIISLALVVITYLAYRRSEEKKLIFVTLSFLAFLAKGSTIAIALFTDWFSFESVILMVSIFDLLILILLFFPFFKS